MWNSCYTAIASREYVLSAASQIVKTHCLGVFSSCNFSRSFFVVSVEHSILHLNLSGISCVSTAAGSRAVIEKGFFNDTSTAHKTLIYIRTHWGDNRKCTNIQSRHWDTLKHLLNVSFFHTFKSFRIKYEQKGLILALLLSRKRRNRSKRSSNWIDFWHFGKRKKRIDETASSSLLFCCTACSEFYVLILKWNFSHEIKYFRQKYVDVHLNTLQKPNWNTHRQKKET